MMNPFEQPLMGTGLGGVTPPGQSQPAAPPSTPPTSQDPFPGSGLTVSQAPPTPEFEAQMDREEKAGAGNLAGVWQENDRLRAAADQAMAA